MVSHPPSWVAGDGVRRWEGRRGASVVRAQRARSAHAQNVLAGRAQWRPNDLSFRYYCRRGREEKKCAGATPVRGWTMDAGRPVEGQ